jgi:hypothetical protein
VLPIRTAEDFMDRGRARRQRRRGVARRRGVLPHVLRLFVEQAGPVSRAALTEAVPGLTAARLDRELARLDAQDHLLLQDGAVVLAYPFSGLPNAFAVGLANGQERYACCAIDALGIAAMLRQRIDIRSRCHHSGEPLALVADPAGPEPAAAGMMVWVGEREAGERRACTTL